MSNYHLLIKLTKIILIMKYPIIPLIKIQVVLIFPILLNKRFHQKKAKKVKKS